MAGCRALTEAEVALISRSFGGRYAARDRALFLLGVHTGFRISELLSLRVGDVWQYGRLTETVSVARRHMKRKRQGRTIALHPVASQAILAWRITSGAFAGVSLEGLNVAAAVAGDRNLGMREMGGEEPTAVKAIIIVDPRATTPQRDALVKLVRELSNGLITHVVRVDVAPVKFATSRNSVEVSVPDNSIQLTVNKEMKHDPSCGAMQWFKPFTTLADAALGVAEEHSFEGQGLNTKWSAPNKRSAFFGTFVH